jgi:hypothetical protein
MRLVLDITRTSDGHYEGSLTVPGSAGRQDFTGILELLAIIEQQLQPQGREDARRHSGTHQHRGGFT